MGPRVVLSVVVASLVLVSAQPGSVVWSQTMNGNAALTSDNRLLAMNGWRVSVQDALTGRTQWMAPSEFSGNNAPAFSPDDRTVYLGYRRDYRIDGFRAANSSDGKSFWEREDLGCRVHGRPTLSINGDVIYLACTDVLALNTRTGGLVWRFSTPDAFAFNTTVVISPDGSLVYAHNRDEMFALNARTGERVWSRILPQMTAKPAFSHDAQLLYVGAGEDLVALDAKNGRTDFTLTGGSSSRRVRTPLVSRDGRRVYFAGSRTLEAWDLPQRTRAWSEFVMWGEITTNLALSSDERHIYCGSSERGGYAWALDVTTGERVWSDSESRRPFGEILTTRDLIYVPGAAMQGFVVYRQR